MYPELIKDVEVLKNSRHDLANGDFQSFSIDDLAKSLAVLAARAEQDKPGHPETVRLREISQKAQSRGADTGELLEGINLAVNAAAGTIGIKRTRKTL